MNGLINLQSFSFALQPEVIKAFGKGYAEHPDQFSAIFDVRSSDRNFERFYKVSGLDLPTAMTDGSSVKYDSMGELWDKTFTHAKYGTGIIVSKDAMDDTKDGIIMELKAMEMGRVMRLKKELLAADYLDSGFTTVNGGDGKELYSASHPTVAGTFSNLASTSLDLSEVALENAVIQIMGMKNERGHLLNVNPRKLVIAKENTFEVKRILGSIGQVYTPDNTLNAIKDLGIFTEGYMVNHYLADQDAFHILTDAAKGEGLIFLNRREPEVTSDNVFDNENAKFKTIMRVSLGHLDPRCIFGNPGV